MSNDIRYFAERQAKDRNSVHHNGGFVSPKIHDLLVRGTITGKELAVYLDIQAFTRNGKGCWMSRRTFGREYNLTTEATKKMIAKLRKLDLVYSEGTTEVRGYDTRVIYAKMEENVSIKIDDKKPEDTPNGVVVLGGNHSTPQGGNHSTPNLQSSLRSDCSKDYTPPIRRGCGGTVAALATARLLVPQKDDAQKPVEDKTMSRENKPISRTSDNGSLVNQNAVDHWCMETALRLRKIIVEKSGRSSSYSAKSWAGEFKTLRAKLAGDENTVALLLDDLEKYWNDFWIKPFSASPHREKFDKLQECAEAVRGKRARAVNPDPAIPDKTSLLILKARRIDPDDIVSQVSDLGFPPSSRRGLREAVLSSCFAIMSVQTRLNALAEDDGQDDDVRRVAADVLCLLQSCPQQATVGWFRRIHDRVKSWASWSGKWSMFVFSEDHEEFIHKIVDKASDNYTGGDDVVRLSDRLLEALKEQPYDAAQHARRLTQLVEDGWEII